MRSTCHLLHPSDLIYVTVVERLAGYWQEARAVLAARRRRR